MGADQQAVADLAALDRTAAAGALRVQERFLQPLAPTHCPELLTALARLDGLGTKPPSGR